MAVNGPGSRAVVFRDGQPIVAYKATSPRTSGVWKPLRAERVPLDSPGFAWAEKPIEIAPGHPGQSFTIGNVVIETTLHEMYPEAKP